MTDKKVCPLLRSGIMANPQGEGIYQTGGMRCLEENCQWWIEYYGLQNCALVGIAEAFILNNPNRRKPDDK